MANFADNIFAIGQSRYETSHRYIKHIKPRSTEMLYDAQHVPSFVLGKRNGNFLSFSFFGWREEAVHLSTKFDSYRLKRSDDIKHLTKLGHTQRQIAERFGTSAASVNRYLQMWSPYDDEQEQIRIEIEQQRERERRDAIRQQQFAEERAKREEEREKNEAMRRREAEESEKRSLVKQPRIDPKLVSPEGKKLTEASDNSGTIYVEEFQADGTAKIWYRFDNSGNRYRCTRTAFGTSRRIIERTVASTS
jgi:predicted transcriptional regulator